MSASGKTPVKGEHLDELVSLVSSFADALARGERPDLEEMCRSHPEHGEDLRRRLEAILFVEGGLPPLPPLPIAASGKAEDEAEASETFGDFRILKELGRGGMGVVYVAEQISLRRKVALKVLAQGIGPLIGDRLLRFRREALAASKLDHPGICTIHGSGEVDGVPYIAMRYLEGETLAQRIAQARAGKEHEPHRQPDSPSTREEIHRALHLIERVARALHVAHEAGLIHRDIKPGNIMVTRDGDPVVLDFGIARDELGAEHSVTRTGELLGTPAYMSPEQLSADRGPLDRRTDVYSLGVTLYECLTLKQAFEAPTREALYRKILTSNPSEARLLNPHLSRDLCVVLATALEKDRDRRYQTALEFAEDLRRLRAFEPIRARPVGAAVRLRRWTQRNPVVAGSLVSVFLLLTTGLSIALALLGRVSAEKERKRALALAHASAEVVEQNPMLALLLAREAVGIERSSDTLSALHRVFPLLHERRVLRGHTAAVRSVVFSHDDELLLTSSTDRTARLWNREGQPLARLAHEDRVNSAVFSPEGQRILTASSDRTARLWDLQERLIAGPLLHDGPVWCATFSKAGTRILTASQGRAILWEASGTRLAELRAPEEAETVQVALFSRDDRILTTSRDGTARLWTEQGKEITVLRGHRGAVHTAAFHPSGTYLVTAAREDREPRVWDREGNPIAVLRGHDNWIWSCAFSPSGEQIVTASTDGTARVWDLTGKTVAVLKGHGATVRDAVFSPSGDRILTASWDHTARLFDLSGNQIAVLAGHDSQVRSPCFSRQGDVIATASWDHTARLWDVSPRELPVVRAHSFDVKTARMTKNGDRTLTASGDRTARLFDRLGNELLVIDGHAGAVTSAVFSPSENEILTTSEDATARLWDLRGNELVRFSGHQNAVWSAVFSPGGDLVLTGSADKTARLWKAGGTFLFSLAHQGEVNAVAFLPNSDRILTASSDRSVRTWDLKGNELSRYTHSAPVYHAVPSPAGNRVLLTTTDDTTATLYDLDWKTICTFNGHEGVVHSVAFSPSGDRVVTASMDATARIWDAVGNEVAVLRGHKGSLYSAAFSPAGDRILTASFDGFVKTWLSQTEDLLRLAHERPSRGFSPVERQRFSELLEEK